jgi:hypothetical protein
MPIIGSTFDVCLGETPEGKDNSRYLQETRKGNTSLQVSISLDVDINLTHSAYLSG